MVTRGFLGPPEFTSGEDGPGGRDVRRGLEEPDLRLTRGIPTRDAGSTRTLPRVCSKGKSGPPGGGGVSHG